MKKKFKMENLDCANCAAKMEDAISKLDGVTDCSVNFLTQKFMLDAEDDKFDAALEEACKIVSRIHHDTKVLV